MIDDLAQHNSQIADGATSLQTFARETGLRYVARHLVVGSGNFVAALCESAIKNVRHAVIDIFRVDEGQIVEHWDVIEELIPEHTWVNSGKF